MGGTAHGPPPQQHKISSNSHSPNYGNIVLRSNMRSS